MIGGHQSETTKVFSSGLLRSVRISQVPLYDSDFTPNEHLQAHGNTVLLYDFGKNSDWMTGSTVSDLSGNGNDGTLRDPWF